MRYPILRPNEIISALSKRGFYFKSQKGSHPKRKLAFPRLQQQPVNVPIIEVE